MSRAGLSVFGRMRRDGTTGHPSAGPGGRDEFVLAKLQLLITNKLDGLLHGDYLGLLPGAGSEPGESREYRPGDDVRRMDWPVTARTTHPHVRTTIADRELETWLAVDMSASLDFGTARCLKRDLALAAVAAMSHLTVRGGNRIGAVVGTGATPTRIPAMPGRKGAQVLLKKVHDTPRAGTGGRTDLAALIDTLNRPPRRRGLAVVISDFLAADGWQQPLRKLGVRHDLLAIEIVDPRELELPDVGVLELVDPETGAVHEIQTADARLRERYRQAAAAQRAGIAAALRKAGAGHLRLRTDSDWLLDIVRFVAARRHARTGGTTR
ncbi:uncharacterized protein (DUF58 family) [Phytomonospora endophytica]|uniref:Uncharacterized protein (DUF58 family) n=2 Tax=Phytomonospora endophytica TaxID=714109 RepID=A0A841FJ46_9ACTN|nr:uncharacterized protein (DUF58 family) [Phytomonospora endophytica]GIG64623.1 hypothetical protein Pen01_09180 [Phytomonospora endophytica]